MRAIDTALGFLLCYSPPFIARWIVRCASQTYLIRLCNRVEKKKNAMPSPQARYSSAGLSLPYGYLFMEYIPRQTLEQLDATAGDNSVSKSLTNRVTKVVAHLQETEVEDVHLWPLHRDLCRRNIIAMDDENRPSANPSNPSNSNSISNSKCDTDCTDRKLCLVDWGHAALLPQVFKLQRRK
ncbi:conserved hypothetical protein [Histoplasma capsulatum H143]|uniref:Aminoglycoside phosphotransferase domain-containing protein n=1 Tax=Ajellomyces capsulatus (strain H143) TaxID=544712 RepID=C6H294_AJECH|nr:conserved hypothetical protein [Histoplasma capsulatum H143]